jgi:glycosyltransferase involved in cell wall biosynthesis
MATIDLFIPNDWFSYVRSALNSWLHPDLLQQIFIHSTEPGRIGGIYHANFKGSSEKMTEEDFNLRRGDLFSSFTSGQRIIRDLEFPLTYRILKKLQNNAILFTVSKIHKNEYLFGVKLHGGRIGDIHDHVFAIYHGIDTKFFRPNPKIEKQGFTIGFIGRCSQVKGIHIIPDLAALLVKKIPEVKFHVVTAADQRNPEYLYLLRKIHELNLNGVIELDNTFYVGQTKVDTFNRWHLSLCPSLYEPQGQIDLEAMACGVPPLVGLGGLREKVIDGFDGVWINPYEVHELAEKVYQLYQGKYNGVTLEEMGKNARDSTEKIWDWEKRADAHKEVIKYLQDGLIDHIEPDLNPLLLPKVELKA